MDALGVECTRSREALERLRCLRVQSDAFFIWHSEPFATITGARLGRVPGRATDWAEINAALGQLALLLSLTAARLRYVCK
jgi:beclin 1